mgnify:CR=1 FL=1|jgi:hypothetical protein
MSECNGDCKILKRVCVFFLGVVIGSAAGYQYGVTSKTQRHHDRFIEESKKPILLEKRERRKKLREHMQRTETPKERVPR